MRAIILEIILVILISLEYVERSSVVGGYSLGSEHLDRKFKDIEDNYTVGPSKRKYLLHRERDVRFLEMELNQALAKKGRFETARGEELNQQLINLLAERKSNAEGDFHRVHVNKGEPRTVERYRPGHLTEFMSGIARTSAPDVAADWERVYGAHGTRNPVHSEASTSGTSSSRRFNVWKPQPDVGYVLGRRREYLTRNQDVPQEFAELAQRTDQARRDLDKGRREPHPARQIFLGHHAWLRQLQEEAENEYESVRRFNKQPQLASQFEPASTTEILKNELINKGFNWDDFKPYFH